MEEKEVQQNNMISNLPLLFANGYPTSLNKITEKQLEIFIPFMVQCSLGQINLQKKIDYSEPEWWPENVQFTIPFSKPKKCLVNWMDKMKEIVIICYQFHKSVFLLRFCNDLAAYEHASLRFINNYNSTTSLFDRRSNKLLVTFRNENMSYDQPQRSRKCLLQQKNKNGLVDQDEHQMMVEPAPFDIYLCDNCDAELYSTDAILEHERTCNLNNNDVISCDTPEPQENVQLKNLKDNERNELRIGFLLNFSLQSGEKKKSSNESSENCIDLFSGMTLKDESNYIILERAKRIPRRNRAVHSLTRCPTIPLSSPAGQLMIRTTKTYVSKEYLNERLERIERFCHAPILTRSSIKPKYFGKRNAPNNIHCTFKKLHEQSTHIYVFPRRQFSQKRRTENFMFFNSQLIKKCRPISVRLKKITENEIKLKRRSINSKLSIKLTRDTSRSSNWKISSSPSSEIIVDTIDLCSSDDESDKTDKAAAYIEEERHNNSCLYKYCFTKSFPAMSPPCSNNVIRCNKLKKIKNILKTSEVTLTPIKKSVSSCKPSNSSSLIQNAINGSVQATLGGNSSRYDSNIRFFNSTSNPEVALTQPKPLQPSVFIFSNYMTSPIAIVSNNNGEILHQRTQDLPENLNFEAQNQENHQESKSNSTSSCSDSNGNKQTISDVFTPNTHALEWFPHMNNLQHCNNVRNISSNSNNSHGRTVDRNRTTRSLPLMQSFGSPRRVISIDLTS